MSITFTRSQRAALEAFKLFMDGSEQVFMLKGVAGTGKIVWVESCQPDNEVETRVVNVKRGKGKIERVLYQ